MAPDKVYAGCLLGAGQLRPWRDAVVHLYLRGSSHPLCGTFASGLIYPHDATLAGNPRCKSCAAIAWRRYPEFTG
jgi:hypothetical protein